MAFPASIAFPPPSAKTRFTSLFWPIFVTRSISAVEASPWKGSRIMVMPAAVNESVRVSPTISQTTSSASSKALSPNF